MQKCNHDKYKSSKRPRKHFEGNHWVTSYVTILDYNGDLSIGKDYVYRNIRQIQIPYNTMQLPVIHITRLETRF